VNLYVPSRLTWRQHGANLSLTQRTEYPHGAHTELELKTDRDTTFALRLRIPAWAGPKSTLSINGERVTADLTPGRFAIVTRTWKSGDRIALEFDIPLTLQAVDPQHPRLVALQHGSLSLFAVNPTDAPVTRANLLNAGNYPPDRSTGKPPQTPGSWPSSLSGNRRGAIPALSGSDSLNPQLEWPMAGITPRRSGKQEAAVYV